MAVCQCPLPRGVAVPTWMCPYRKGAASLTTAITALMAAMTISCRLIKQKVISGFMGNLRTLMQGLRNTSFIYYHGGGDNKWVEQSIWWVAEVSVWVYCWIEFLFLHFRVISKSLCCTWHRTSGLQLTIEGLFYSPFKVCWEVSLLLYVFSCSCLNI